MKTIIGGDRVDRCYICGRTGHMEVHHMMHGANRRNADRYGLTVHLCRDCHTAGTHAVHRDRTVDLYLIRLAQETFEKKWGHDEWMRVFGRNYGG